MPTFLAFKSKLFFLFALVTWLLSACGNDSPNPPSNTINFDVSITLDNVGSSAWIVTNVTGASGVATFNTNNTPLVLESGKRYRFINNGGTAHPLDFRNEAGAVLLSQNNQVGAFEDNAAVDFQSDSEGLTFTLTQELFDVLASYHCSIHAAMRGDINLPPPSNNTNSDVQITLTNIGASAYQVTAVTGETGVATLNVDNPTLTFTNGKRYAITNQATTGHPFALRNNANAILLSQGSNAGTLADDEGIDFYSEGNTIYFNVNSTFATLVANYVCIFHASMSGSVVIN